MAKLPAQFKSWRDFYNKVVQSAPPDLNNRTKIKIKSTDLVTGKETISAFTFQNIKLLAFDEIVDKFKNVLTD